MPCCRCAGAGYFAAYAHVAGGVCFRCGGTGRDPAEGLFYCKKIRQEKKIGDTRVTLEPRVDLTGRFAGYEVAANGRPAGTARRLAQARRIFQEVVANLVQVNSNRLKEPERLFA